MMDALRKFVRTFGASEPRRRFGDDDQRLALAALLVHCMSVDGSVSEAERAKLRDMLGRTFGLEGEDLQGLIDDAIAAEQEAVDLYRFTSVLKRQMNEAERVRVVENLWEIVFADGTSHEFEENLVWRVSELLAVNRHDRIASKREAAESRLGEATGKAGH
jgi:uncharacterized tellurite resistance protein B-like protein